ncbi:hypothetical protein [Sphingomonas sp. MMS24-J13]|uniref:hypothetical protein n=1 Tax=Sphingomonas sp. MMS24-J13 TaxID=3238686 RepID=UPI00384BA650
MTGTIATLLRWGAALWACASAALAVQCVTKCRADLHHGPGMQCWFSEHTGLPCDTGTLILLVLSVVAGLWIAVFGSVVADLSRPH